MRGGSLQEPGLPIVNVAKADRKRSQPAGLLHSYTPMIYKLIRGWSGRSHRRIASDNTDGISYTTHNPLTRSYSHIRPYMQYITDENIICVDCRRCDCAVWKAYRGCVQVSPDE